MTRGIPTHSDCVGQGRGEFMPEVRVWKWDTLNDDGRRFYVVWTAFEYLRWRSIAPPNPLGLLMIRLHKEWDKRPRTGGDARSDLLSKDHETKQAVSVRAC